MDHRRGEWGRVGWSRKTGSYCGEPEDEADIKKEEGRWTEPGSVVSFEPLAQAIPEANFYEFGLQWGNKLGNLRET